MPFFWRFKQGHIPGMVPALNLEYSLMKIIMMLVCVLLAAVMAAGCVSSEPESGDSELPWNSPASWEGGAYGT
jgi:hypothetical protein